MTQLHQKPRSEQSLSDEWETPNELFNFLIGKTGISPKIDVCATYENRKCPAHFGFDNFDKTIQDGLNTQWFADSWCNPPHSLTGKFVEKAYRENKENNIKILMLIPANTMSSNYFHEYVLNNVRASYFPIKGRIKFLQNGKESKFISRNAYICVVFNHRLDGFEL